MVPLPSNVNLLGTSWIRASYSTCIKYASCTGSAPITAMPRGPCFPRCSRSIYTWPVPSSQLPQHPCYRFPPQPVSARALDVTANERTRQSHTRPAYQSRLPITLSMICAREERSLRFGMWPARDMHNVARNESQCASVCACMICDWGES
jgi:hypothetical protein